VFTAFGILTSKALIPASANWTDEKDRTYNEAVSKNTRIYEYRSANVAPAKAARRQPYDTQNEGHSVYHLKVERGYP